MTQSETTHTQGHMSRWCTEFDHYDESIAPDPHVVYDELRRCCPVAWHDSNEGFWHVTRYDLVEGIVKHPETFSSVDTSVPRVALGGVRLAPITLDPPRHGPFRKLLLPAFAPGVVERATGPTREFVRGLVKEHVERGGCDVAHDYARLVPVFMLCSTLGIPMEDRDRFTGWVSTMVERPMHIDPEGAGAAVMDLMAYCVEQVDKRAADPGDDLISLLLRNVEEGEQLSQEDVLNAVFLFILAGVDTTWSVIGAALWHLALHDEDRKRLIDGDDELYQTAVEEFLRYYTPAVLGRTALTDVEVGGQTIQAGDLIMVNYPAANRDPEAFPDADKVVIDRKVNRHLALGVGIHRCLGAGFARMMIKVALEEWLRAVPEYRLEDPSDVRWSSGMIWGPRKVRVKIGDR